MQQLAHALSFSPDWVVLLDQRDLRILEVNREPAFGYPELELLRLRFPDLFSGVSEDLVERALAGRHDPHPDVPLRVLCRTREGREVPVDVRLGRTSEDGPVIAIVRPVSEEARIAERELVSVICAAPMAICTFTLEGKIVSWNPGAERLYGHRADRAVGAGIELFVPDSERETFLRAQRRALDEDRLPPALVARKALGGDPILVEESLFLIRDVARQPIRFGCFSRAAGAPEASLPRERSAELPSKSASMSEARGAIELAIEAPDAAVLILGETGVGKSWLARIIHEKSARGSGAFVEVSCANLDPLLFDSELFGHERGAFTGAVACKPGLVEAADGGTLFLDEIGDMPLSAQAKLLAFLDHRTFRRVGSTKSAAADVRVIAATNVDLGRAVAEKRFREDLYYRLDVLPIRLPPLRERRDDLPELIETVLKRPISIAPEAMEALLSHRWPGNLRELRNVLERALLKSRRDAIELEHLPRELSDAPRIEEGTLEQLENATILRVLAEHRGNRSQAARALGISRSTLLRRLAALES